MDDDNQYTDRADKHNKSLYDSTINSNLLKIQKYLHLPTILNVIQVILLSPVPFNIFIELIMHDILDNHQSIISIGGRSIYNRFTTDIDMLTGSESELQALIDSLNTYFTYIVCQ